MATIIVEKNGKQRTIDDSQFGGFERAGYSMVSQAPAAPTQYTAPAAQGTPFKEGLTDQQKNSITNLVNTGRQFNETDARNFAYSMGRNDWQSFVGLTGNEAMTQIGGAQTTVATKETIDKLYNDAVAANPAISELAKGGSSLEEIINALSTGNLAGVVDWNGQPFSAEDQQAALTQGMEDNKLYYEALQQKETADAEAKLAQDQADYQNYLITSGQSFEADKAKSDQQAADSGILFSGSRAQKEKNLARAYNQDQAYTQNKVARNIGNVANDFQYKYGADATKGLNKYYNLGGNTFNPNVARGGVGTSELSSVYSPSNYNYQGTVNTEKLANANTRAAGYLWNKGNKLLQTGYNNQY